MGTINNKLSAQIGFRLSSSPNVKNDNLSIDGLVLQIKNFTKFNGECELKIYSDRFQQKLLASSQKIIISDELHSFDLNEIFSTASFPWETLNSNTVCFQLVSVKQKLPLGLSCFDLVASNNSKAVLKEELAKSKTSKLKKVLDLNTSMQVEAFPSSKFGQDRYLLDYAGELRVKEIPIKFQGYVQNSKDPFFDYSLANGSVFFDVNEWKRIILNKIQPKINENIDSILYSFDDYEEMLDRKDYVKKILENPSFLKDLDLLDSIPFYKEALNLNPEEDLEAYKNGLKTKLDQEISKLQAQVDESNSTEKLDSLRSEVQALQESIEELEKFESLINKRKAFDNLMNVQDEAQQYLDKANDLKSEYVNKVDRILKDPKKVNELLKKEGLGDKYTYIMNAVSALKFGNINPAYSDLVLQNSQLKGGMLGFDFGKFGFSTFYGKSQNRNLITLGDSSINVQHLMGLELNYELKENVENSIYLISGKEKGLELNESESSMLVGYKSSYTFLNNQVLSFDVALFDPFNQSQKQLNEIAALKIGHDAMALNGKFNFHAEGTYFGSEYKDINNPYLVNNSAEFSTNLNYSVLKELNIGVNALVQKNGVNDVLNQLERKAISAGIIISLAVKKLPMINYVLNQTTSTLGTFEMNTIFQNINFAKSYKIAEINLQSFANLNFINNQSNTDSLNTKTSSFLISQEITWNKFMRTSIAYNQHTLESETGENESERSFSIKFPIEYRALNISPGLQFLSRNGMDEFGYSLDAVYDLLKDFTVTLNINSHSLQSFLKQNGVIENEYTPAYNARLNYRF